MPLLPRSKENIDHFMYPSIFIFTSSPCGHCLQSLFFNKLNFDLKNLLKLHSMRLLKNVVAPGEQAEGLSF